jgi:hypothetical protein
LQIAHLLLLISALRAEISSTKQESIALPKAKRRRRKSYQKHSGAAGRARINRKKAPL